jgi:tRNA(fMet)-specific endonuclease VapC
VKFLLDTNSIIAVIKGNARVLSELRKHSPQDFAIPAIALHQLFYGAFRSARVQENLERIDRLQFAVLEFEPEDARQSGRIRAELAALGTPIGPYDVLIAGQAVARNLILISRNKREFARVDGLRTEDWEG